MSWSPTRLRQGLSRRVLLVALGGLLLLGTVGMGVQTVMLTRELDERVAITEDLADGNIRTLGQVQRELLKLDNLLVETSPDPEAVQLQESLTAQRVQEGTLSFQAKTLGSQELLSTSRDLARQWSRDVRPLVEPAAEAPADSPQRAAAEQAVTDLELGYNQLVSDGEIQRKARAAESNATVSDLVVGSRRLLLRLSLTSVLFLGFLFATTMSLRRLDRQRARDADELRKHAFVVQSTDNMVIITDAAGRIEWVNDAFERVSGWPLTDVTGRRPGEFLHGPDTDPAAVAQMRACLAAGEGFTCEVVNYARDGRRYWVALEVTPVRDDAGRTTGYVALETDVTEQRETEELLRTAKEAAEESAREKSAFLASMSHEIRTPLNAVLGLTDMLQLTDLDDEQREYVSTAQDSGQLLLALVNDILDFSALEAGRVETEARAFSPATLVHDTVAMFGPEARSRSLELLCEVDDDVPPALLGDETRLRQVLVNLVANAVKFTEVGCVRVQAQARPTPASDSHGSATGTGTGTELVLRVRDTGIGIDPARLSRLFQPFAQGDSSTTRKYGGTGLGLAICRLLVERMGGRIELDSTSGEGSTFTVVVPLATAPVESLPRPDHTLEVAVPPLRILLAEDDSVNQMVISTMLRRLGSDPEIVSDGVAAVDAVARADSQGEPFDVVLMDVHMPVMDGVQATAELRSRPGRRPHVVAVTANALPGDRERLLAGGFDDYQPKPVRLADLRDRLLRGAAAQGIGEATTATVARRADERAATPPPAVDEAAFEQLLGARDPDLLTDLVAKLLDGARDLLGQIPTADHDGPTPDEDVERLHDLAHRMRSSSASCGAATLSSLAGELEEATSGGSSRDLGDLGARWQQQTEQIAVWLAERRLAGTTQG